MKVSSVLNIFLLAPLLSGTHGLERKRTEVTQVDSQQEIQECVTSDTGDSTCVKPANDDKNGSNTDGLEETENDPQELQDCDVGLSETGELICVEPKEDDDEEEEEDELCKDTHENCAFWASLGECSKNPNYMLTGCPKSCNTCPKKVLGEMSAEQNRERKLLLAEVAKYGEPQQIGSSKDEVAETLFVIRQTVDYMKNFVHSEKPTHKLTKETLDACKNIDARCSFWVTHGECEANPSFMVTKCAPACLSCHKIDYNTRCGERDPNAAPGLEFGEMNLMFERIVETAPGNVSDATQLAAQEGRIQEDGTPIYTVTVHSRPESPSPKPDENGVIPTDSQRDRKEAPWVITFDNFMTSEECQHLINQGYRNGYERSTDVGKRLADGSYDKKQSTGRTSENSWCDSKSGCRQDPVVDRILKRLANVTGIPDENYEDLQLLKYEVGQYYNAHHDYITHQRDRHSGPRILTFFLYLSDVEEGGGTKLNDLDIVIQPKMGRALLWPSVMNYNPLDKDFRTRHEALVVEKGTKFAANAWIHLFNSLEAHKMGCN